MNEGFTNSNKYTTLLQHYHAFHRAFTIFTLPCARNSEIEELVRNSRVWLLHVRGFGYRGFARTAIAGSRGTT